MRVFRLTGTARPQRELPEHGQREGIQGAELRGNAPNKHRSHDQDPGGANAVSEYERRTTQKRLYIVDLQNRMTLVNFDTLWLQISALGN